MNGRISLAGFAFAFQRMLRSTVSRKSSGAQTKVILKIP